jgi:hypothetical protein
MLSRGSAMAKPTTLFAGLDGHKEFNTVAHADAASPDPPESVGPIGTRQVDIEKQPVRRLRSKAHTSCSPAKLHPSRASSVAPPCSVARPPPTSRLRRASPRRKRADERSPRRAHEEG